MSKEKNELRTVSWGYGWVVSENFPEQIIGKVLTLIEAMGLPERQEGSVKDLIRQVIWDRMNEDGINIKPERHTAIREEYYEKKQDAQSKSIPMSAV